jgi:hypothetical protein
VRWLNGYRVLEWHFEQGAAKLAQNRAYIEFLGRHGSALDPFLSAKQTRKGILEEVRALVAHAVLSRNADPNNAQAGTELVKQTFPVLMTLVVALMSEGTNGTVSISVRRDVESRELRGTI